MDRANDRVNQPATVQEPDDGLEVEPGADAPASLPEPTDVPAADSGSRVVSELREWVRVIVFVGAFYFALTALVAEGYYIPSCSMEPTLLGARSETGTDGTLVERQGDRILALKGVYLLSTPQRGDIVIFRRVEGTSWDDGMSEDTTLLVKRIVGLPGEQIQIRDSWVWVRGLGEEEFRPVARSLFPEDQEYENRGSYGTSGLAVEIPDGCYFVLGDNTYNSNDSRIWGFLPRSHIKGKAILRFWPPARIGTLR